MQQLASTAGLMISQVKEWGEIITGFETQNKYVVSDEDGNVLYVAGEEGGSLLARWFLKALRPFTIELRDGEHRPVLQVQRPFRFFFHRAEIRDAAGDPIGSVERRFAFFRRKYAIFDGDGREIFQLFGPLLRPWTFRIMADGGEIGKITKKWSGLLKESFSDADNFALLYPRDWDARLKALLLGTVFLIDFVHFENTGKD